MLNLFCCAKCEETLCQWGELIFLVFEQICEHYIIEQAPLEIPCVEEFDYDSLEEKLSLIEFFSLSTSTFLRIVEFLEAKHYVITTECGVKCIKIKPNGSYLTKKFSRSLCQICFNGWVHE